MVFLTPVIIIFSDSKSGRQFYKFRKVILKLSLFLKIYLKHSTLKYHFHFCKSLSNAKHPLWIVFFFFQLTRLSKRFINYIICHNWILLYFNRLKSIMFHNVYTKTTILTVYSCRMQQYNNFERLIAECMKKKNFCKSQYVYFDENNSVLNKRFTV